MIVMLTPAVSRERTGTTGISRAGTPSSTGWRSAPLPADGNAGLRSASIRLMLYGEGRGSNKITMLAKRLSPGSGVLGQGAGRGGLAGP